MWYSLKFSTAMNRLQTGWVILMAASTTKRGPLRFSLVFLVKLGFTSNFIQQGVATVATFALSFSQHSCRDSFGRRSAKCSWPAGVANARRVPRWNSFFLCLSVLLFGVQESTVISKFIYIYIYLVRSHLEMWQQCWVASLEAKARWVVSCNHPISCILQCRSGTELAMKPRKIMIMISRSILPAQVPG